MNKVLSVHERLNQTPELCEVTQFRPPVLVGEFPVIPSAPPASAAAEAIRSPPPPPSAPSDADSDPPVFTFP